MTDAVGSIDTSNADSGAEATDAVDTSEAVTATETQAPAPSQAEIAAQAAALAAASVAAAEAEAVVEDDVASDEEADDKSAKKSEDEDEDDKSEADEEDVAAETLADVEAIVDAAAAQDMDDMDDDDDGFYDDDDDDTVSPFLAVGLTALVIGGGLLILSSNDDDDDDDLIDINIPPVAQDLTVTVNEDETVSDSVDAIDPDDNSLTFSLVGDAPAGLTFNSDGTFTFDASADEYQDLNDGETLDVVVNFTASDGIGTSTGQLTITINGVTDNNAPVAVDDSATTDEDTDVTIDVLANDTDADDGDMLALVSATVPAEQGTVTINDDDTITFSPADDFNGTATITYTVSDGTAEDTGTVTVVVNPQPDALDAIDDAIVATEDSGTLTGDLTANDIDVDGGDVSVMLAAGSTLPPGFTLNSDGTYSLDTSAAGYQSLSAGETATFTFDYVLSDADGNDTDSDDDPSTGDDSDSDPDTATVTLTVTGVNDAPTANADTVDTDFDTAVTIDVLDNDTDPDDDDDLTVTAASSDDGTVVINDDGTITFTPDAGFEGDAVITYTISDGEGGTASSTATVTVAEEGSFDFISLDVDDDNDNATRFEIREDGAVTGPVLDADDGAFNFTDDQDLQNNVSVLNFGDNDTITFNADPSDVAFASGDFDGDGQADDVEIAVNIGGVVSQVFLLNAVADGAVVFNETTAEAAIGPDTNNFLFGDELPDTDNTGGPGEGTSIAASADQDDDGDTNTQFLLPEDGDDGAFDFTDDSSIANNVAIDNFGDDDTLTFLVDDASDVAFASGDFDGDGQADDLQIAINIGGVVSEIVLLNSVEDGAVVFNEQQAEDAIGPGTENFIFDTGSDSSIAPMADETAFLG